MHIEASNPPSEGGRSVATAVHHVARSLRQVILGQEALVDRLLIALLSGGHLLVEGAPGLAKTTAVKALAERIEGEFHRIQFTPDLLPADLTGTEIYRPQETSFVFQPGPIFHNIVLADEVNRAPAKVQSALLEAMAERQVTIGRKSYPLPPLFMVMATQNPIEQEGTYPLPEAQLDRFLLHVRIDYPSPQVEFDILSLARRQATAELGMASRTRRVGPVAEDAIQPETTAPAQISMAQVFAARGEVLRLHLAPELERYLVSLVLATREPAPYGEDLAHWVAYGASPRATIGWDRCARAHAYLRGRDYVSPEDIQALSHDVLRHRVILSYEAQAQGISADEFITQLIERVPVP